jgi:cell division protein FtsQ
MALMVGCVVLVIGAAVCANIWKRDIPLRSVRVSGNRLVSAAEVVRLAAIPERTHLFSVDLSAVQRRVQRNPFVRMATVNRDVRGEIMIEVVERNPIAAMVTDRLLYLDADGVVLPQARAEPLFDLPVLTGDLPLQDCVPGKRLSSAGLREALDILSTARRGGEDLYGKISEVHVSDTQDLILYTSEGGIPVIFGRGDAAEKLARLDGFWNDIVGRRGSRNLQYIDVRFEDEVVARWGNAPASHRTEPFRRNDHG